MGTYRGIVRKSDIDHMGHMNVTYYMQMFDEATWAFFAELGMGASSMSENRRAVATLVAERDGPGGSIALQHLNDQLVGEPAI